MKVINKFKYILDKQRIVVDHRQYKYKTIVKNFDVKYYRFEDFGLRNKVYKKMTRI